MTSGIDQDIQKSVSLTKPFMIQKNRGRNPGWRIFPFLRRIFRRGINSRTSCVRSQLLIGFIVVFNIIVYNRWVQTGLRKNGVTANKKLMQTPKTTIVLMGYSMERIDNYKRILPAYGEMNSVLDRIIFVWNNKEDGPPPTPKDTLVPFDMLVQKENSMNNRFGPDVLNCTSTDTVLLIDDDVLLSEGMVSKMLQFYYDNEKSQPSTGNHTTIVGISNDARIASSNNGYIYPCHRIEGYIFSLACWKSPFSKLPPPNVVIGKTMLLNKKWLTAYQSDAELWSYTGEQKHFCEDILMNALIRNSTIHPTLPVFVDKDRHSKREILEESGGLSSKGFSSLMWGFEWANRRTECVKWAMDHFGNDVWK